MNESVARLLQAAVGYLDKANECLCLARDECEEERVAMVAAWNAADKAAETVRAAVRRMVGWQE